MKFCNQCGSALPPTADFCPVCGVYVSYAKPSSENFSAAHTPRASSTDFPTSSGSFSNAEEEIPPFAQWNSSEKPSWQQDNGPRYRPAACCCKESLTTGQYLLTFLLFSIPVIGLIMTLVCAFSSEKGPRRNLARGFFFYRLIIDLLLVIASLIIGFLVCFVYPVNLYDSYYDYYDYYSYYPPESGEYSYGDEWLYPEDLYGYYAETDPETANI